MIKLYDEALSGLDNKSCKTGSVLLDISKAFDCVDHEILLHKLQHYGIRGKVCKWFESFLANRTHYVEINGIRSDSYTPDIGAPQGSVLGPILFIIYVNDLPSSSSLFSFSVFADDTSLLLKSCRDVYHNTYITELNKVMDWFKLNKLLLTTKSHSTFTLVPIIQFSTNQNFCYRIYTKSAQIIYYFLKNILI